MHIYHIYCVAWNVKAEIQISGNLNALSTLFEHRVLHCIECLQFWVEFNVVSNAGA